MPGRRARRRLARARCTVNADRRFGAARPDPAHAPEHSPCHPLPRFRTRAEPWRSESWREQGPGPHAASSPPFAHGGVGGGRGCFLPASAPEQTLHKYHSSRRRWPMDLCPLTAAPGERTPHSTPRTTEDSECERPSCPHTAVVNAGQEGSDGTAKSIPFCFSEGSRLVPEPLGGHPHASGLEGCRYHLARRQREAGATRTVRAASLRGH